MLPYTAQKTKCFDIYVLMISFQFCGAHVNSSAHMDTCSLKYSFNMNNLEASSGTEGGRRNSLWMLKSCSQGWGVQDWCLPGIWGLGWDFLIWDFLTGDLGWDLGSSGRAKPDPHLCEQRQDVLYFTASCHSAGALTTNPSMSAVLIYCHV